jgi:hypothetical protein
VTAKRADHRVVKTVNALGLNFREMLVARADEVIP